MFFVCTPYSAPHRIYEYDSIFQVSKFDSSLMLFDFDITEQLQHALCKHHTELVTVRITWKSQPTVCHGCTSFQFGTHFSTSHFQSHERFKSKCRNVEMVFWFVREFGTRNISHIWGIQCRHTKRVRSINFWETKFIGRHLMIIHLLRSFQHSKRFENNHLNQKHNANKQTNLHLAT